MRKNENNIIPQGYKNSPLGIIPDEWEVKKLGEIAIINPPRDKNISNHVSFITMSDVSEFGFIKNETTVKASEIKSGFTPFRKNDILVAKITPCFENGKGAFLHSLKNENGFGSTEFHVIRPNVNGEFLFYHTIGFKFRKKLEAEMTGSAGQKRVPAISISAYKIPLPPLPEQRKIAEVLSTCDKAIEKQTLLVEKLELRKKGLMQQLLTGKKRLPGFSGVAWKKVKLDEVTTFLSNNSLSRDNLNTLRGSILNIHYGDVLIKLPTIVDVSLVDLPFINEELNIVSKDYVSEGDIIMADTAEDGTVGKACEVVNVGNNKVVSGLHTILIHPTIAFAPMFLGYYLNSKEYHKQILSIMQGIKVYSITKDALRKTNIKIPPLEEQNAIAEILSVCDNEITLAKQKLDTLRQQKKGLMQVLLTGKKRVEL